MHRPEQNLLQGLNPQQKEAVVSNAQQLLVLAGAGSGKTKVLTHRIAWLLQHQLAYPDNILAVTFTNKAAAEMRSRIERLMQASTIHTMHASVHEHNASNLSARNMWVGTFHGLAHRLLRKHAEEVGLSPDFQIMDSQDQLSMIKRIHKEQSLDEKRWQPTHSQWFINHNKDEGIRANRLHDTSNMYNQTLAQIYLQYEQHCRRNGLIDFAELILASCELIQRNPELAEHYNRRFQYILVDEFQDTNTMQYHWIRSLARHTSSLTIVGDDDQSIYGWRGARIENIEQLHADYPDIVLIKLEQNYRSTNTILEAANQLIRHNLGRMGKNLWTESNQGQLIQLYAAYNEYDEAKFITSNIKRLFDQGHHYGETAVLYRSNAQSRILEEALLQYNIPYRIYGGQRFYERMEIKNILAYLRLIQNTDDDSAFERIINVPNRGIGEKTVQNIRDYARQNNSTMYHAANLLLQEKQLASRSYQAIDAFMQLIQMFQQQLKQQQLAAFVEHVIKTIDLAEHHRKEKGEKTEARLENLNEFINAVAQFSKNEQATGSTGQQDNPMLLHSFLAQVSLDAGERQAEDYADAVQLMTLHAAKGLEFPYVFLAGLEEGLFPHAMSADDPKKLEEERRLCYVGITRAMQQLFISYAESRRVRGNESHNIKSRFITEIPETCFELVRAQRAPLFQQRSGYQPSYSRNAYTKHKNLTEQPSPDTGFHMGQRVKHQVFGVGTIISAEGQGDSARIQVHFDDQGSKWLIASYAKLSRV